VERHNHDEEKSLAPCGDHIGRGGSRFQLFRNRPTDIRESSHFFLVGHYLEAETFQTAIFIPRDSRDLKLEDDNKVANGVSTVHNPGTRPMVAGDMACSGDFGQWALLK
jgi:hypothetical protein